MKWSTRSMVALTILFMLTLGCVVPFINAEKPAADSTVSSNQVSNTPEPDRKPSTVPPVSPTQPLPEPTLNSNTPIPVPAEMSGGGETEKPSEPLEEVYTDPQKLFTVKYPVEWRLSRSGGWQEICLDEEKYVCFSAQISDYPKDGSLNTFLDDTYENFKRAVGNYELMKREEIMLGGYPAVFFENSYTFQDNYHQGFAVYLINNNKHVGYVMQATIIENMQDYDLYYETLRQMIYSFSPGK